MLWNELFHIDWSIRFPLQYYYNDGRHVIFDKYEIDMFGGIYNKETDSVLSVSKNGRGYNTMTVVDSSGMACGIQGGRAILSSIIGPPPILTHTAEHIDCHNKDNDIVCELTWIDKSGQAKNRVFPEENLSAFVIVRDNIEMTTKEWVKYLSEQQNPYGRKYTKSVIEHYAQRKQHGFSYKVYEDLLDETWYEIKNSQSNKGRWEISDKNRIAYITLHARNVLDMNRFGLTSGYPTININGKSLLVHRVAFEAYYPDVFRAMKPGEMILHKFDNKLNFQPHLLYIGNKSRNMKDSYDNGRRSRRSCISYVEGTFEKYHESQSDAADYVRTKGYSTARDEHIRRALVARDSGKVITRYGRTWQRV